MTFFQKVKTLFLKIVCPVEDTLWITTWSNIRWSKVATGDRSLDEQDKVSTLFEIQLLLRRLYSKFEWTEDTADQLWDSFCPPEYNYKRYKEGILKDDCDGYHALVYHCLYNSGFTESYLLTVIGVNAGHCVFLFKHTDGLWRVIDYDNIYPGYQTAKEAVTAYNKEFANIYNGGESVIYNCTNMYDYDKTSYKEAKNIIK